MGSVASVCFENMALPVGAWFLFILFATISPMGRRRVRIRIRRRERGAVSPAVAFAVLVVVLAAALIGFALLEKDDEDGRPAPSPAGTVPSDEEDLSLTDAEAIALFRELDGLRIQALEDRDMNLLRTIYTRQSPALQRGLRSIKQLKRTGVVVDEKWRLRSTTIRSNNPEEIVVRGKAVSDVEFLSEDGSRIPGRSRRELRTFECLLRTEGLEWLLHDCTVLEASPIA